MIRGHLTQSLIDVGLIYVEDSAVYGTASDGVLVSFGVMLTQKDWDNLEIYFIHNPTPLNW